MAKVKKKLLPKNFEELLKESDLESLKAIFQNCDVDARGGYTKQTALAFNDCPDDLVRWLLGQGADLMAEDSYGETALHARARHWQGRIEILLELGANVEHGEDGRGTPLHLAAGTHNLRTTRILLQHGASADALNREKMTPLSYALQRCTNASLPNMAAIAELLLEADPPKPEKPRGIFSRLFGPNFADDAKFDAKARVTQIGTDFEFHRGNYNPDSVDAASAALDRLYELFGVTPVPRRVMHDGNAKIVAKSKNWQDIHQELWELLVPSHGHAVTAQGEVIRISGRINDEMERNGGCNWDADYNRMAAAFLKLISSGQALSDVEQRESEEIVKALSTKQSDTARLCELAVCWVGLNPMPVKLSQPNYGR